MFVICSTLVRKLPPFCERDTNETRTKVKQSLDFTGMAISSRRECVFAGLKIIA
jgi:hypothetical protein